jgi:hypothetical protein
MSALALKIDALQTQVDLAIEDECLVFYSAFEYDKNKIPTDNLYDIALHGKVKIIQPQNYFVKQAFESPVLTNPTWLALAKQANEQIKITEDHTHRYFETFKIIDEADGVKTIQLFMGS